MAKEIIKDIYQPFVVERKTKKRFLRHGSAQPVEYQITFSSVRPKKKKYKIVVVSRMEVLELIDKLKEIV